MAPLAADLPGDEVGLVAVAIAHAGGVLGHGPSHPDGSHLQVPAVGLAEVAGVLVQQPPVEAGQPWGNDEPGQQFANGEKGDGYVAASTGFADAAPDIGDSAIIELVGLGGAAAAASSADHGTVVAITWPAR